MSDWQPMETAPKDGTRILVACPASDWPEEWGLPTIASFDPIRDLGGHWGPIGRDCWHAVDEQCGGVAQIEPTHWMSLPELPNP